MWVIWKLAQSQPVLLTLFLSLSIKAATMKRLLILSSAQRHRSKVKDAQLSAQPVARHQVMCLQRSEEKGSKQLSAPARPAAAGDRQLSVCTDRVELR